MHAITLIAIIPLIMSFVLPKLKERDDKIQDNKYQQT